LVTGRRFAHTLPFTVAGDGSRFDFTITTPKFKVDVGAMNFNFLVAAKTNTDPAYYQIQFGESHALFHAIGPLHIIVRNLKCTI